MVGDGYEIVWLHCKYTNTNTCWLLVSHSWQSCLWLCRMCVLHAEESNQNPPIWPAGYVYALVYCHLYLILPCACCYATVIVHNETSCLVRPLMLYITTFFAVWCPSESLVLWVWFCICTSDAVVCIVFGWWCCALVNNWSLRRIRH